MPQNTKTERLNKTPIGNNKLLTIAQVSGVSKLPRALLSCDWRWGLEDASVITSRQQNQSTNHRGLARVRHGGILMPQKKLRSMQGTRWPGFLLSPLVLSLLGEANKQYVPDSFQN